MLESLEISQPALHAHLCHNERRITDICFNSSTRLFTSSLDGTCIEWNLKGKRPHIVYNVHEKPVLSVCYNKKTNFVATASTDKTVKMFQPTRHTFKPQSVLHSAKVRGLDINEAQQILATIADDNAVKIWDLDYSRCIYSHMMAVPQKCWFRSVKIDTTGNMVAAAGQDRRIRIYDIRTSTAVHIFKETTAVARKINWHPDNYLLAAAFNDNCIKIFNVCTGEELQVYDVHSAPINDIAFHPSGVFLAAACDDKSVKILDLMLGKPLYTLIGHDAAVNSVKFNIDGAMLASGDDKGHLLIWKTNLESYDRTSFSLESSNKETMDAGGEIDEDKSIVVDQRKTKNYLNKSTSLVVESKNNAIPKKKEEFPKRSRIPLPKHLKTSRYETDDY